jgi:hypothetical protein
MKITKVVGGLIVAFCVMPTDLVLAQTTPPPVQTPPTTAQYSDLVNQGFEIKSTILMSETASQLVGATQSQPTLMVTLQKGPAIATCWVLFSAWNTQALVNNLPCNLLH